MKKVTFVILHYNNIDDTKNCINSINNLNKKDIDIRIVLVDNHSTNNSGIELEKMYKNDKYIKVILLDKNYGFSAGNNIGYSHAIKDDPDTIMVINNDILFEDNNFLDDYYKFVNGKEYDIICPDIINFNNQHQNPLSLNITTKRNAIKNIIKNRIYYFLFLIPGINRIVYNFKSNYEKKWFDNYYEGRKKLVFDKNDFIPFGAFLIYSNNWLKKEEIAFPSKTFMYMEEDILYLYIKRNNYKLAYCDNISVRHLEGRSTNNRTNNAIKNSRFQAKTKANSLKEYLKVLKEMR